MSNLAPIVLFVYNRPRHVKQTIEALLQNKYADQSDLIIYSDGYKSESDRENITSVRSYIKTIKGFRSVTIYERERNFGLGNNIIDGVTNVLKQHKKVIVLEDDLITSPHFLTYLNEGLNLYEKSENVISIHSYVYPIKKKLPETFFIKGADCLGWATWDNKWKLFERDGKILLNKIIDGNYTTEFDFNFAYPYTQMLKDQIEGKNSSWAVRWYASAFLNNMLTLYPGRSLVFHNGNDGSGTNFGQSSFLDVKLSPKPIQMNPLITEENTYARKIFERFMKYNNASWIRIIYRKVKRLVLSKNLSANIHI